MWVQDLLELNSHQSNSKSIVKFHIDTTDLNKGEIYAF